jgi:hypothetical protein
MTNELAREVGRIGGLRTLMGASYTQRVLDQMVVMTAVVDHGDPAVREEAEDTLEDLRGEAARMGATDEQYRRWAANYPPAVPA